MGYWHGEVIATLEQDVQQLNPSIAQLSEQRQPQQLASFAIHELTRLRQVSTTLDEIYPFATLTYNQTRLNHIRAQAIALQQTEMSLVQSHTEAIVANATRMYFIVLISSILSLVLLLGLL